MRRLLFPLSLLLLAAARADDTPRAATPEEQALFKDALRNSAQDPEHWAYTETSRMAASKGKVPGETVVRFDPSKPYADQFTPLKVDGREPTQKDFKEYRKRGEKRGEQVAKAAEAARDPGAPSPRPQLRIAGGSVTLDPEHPQVVWVRNGTVLFEVPLQTVRRDIPVEKLRVLVLVGQSARQVERLALRVRESFRVKLVAKVKAGEANLEFAVVDPRFGPVITSLTGDFSASLLFVPINGTFERTRTDWKRVKSYDERLQVRLGPLQFLDS